MVIFFTTLQAEAGIAPKVLSYSFPIILTTGIFLLFLNTAARDLALCQMNSSVSKKGQKPSKSAN